MVLPNKSNLPGPAVPWGRAVGSELVELRKKVDGLESSFNNERRVSVGLMDRMADTIQTLSGAVETLDSTVAELNVRRMQVFSREYLSCTIPAFSASATSVWPVSVAGGFGGDRHALIGLSFTWKGSSTVNHQPYRLSRWELKQGGFVLRTQGKTLRQGAAYYSEFEERYWLTSYVSLTAPVVIPESGASFSLDSLLSRENATNSSETSVLEDVSLTVQLGELV